MFILLPLSDEGLPANLEEKIAIIDKIAGIAFKMGFDAEDIVVDGLVTTIGANPFSAREFLDTIRYCKKNNLATICGLSNISFGLPERGLINTVFLTMAIREGLTMAIANPSQELLMNSVFASDLLMNKEEADTRYIDRMNAYNMKKTDVIPTFSSAETVSLQKGKDMTKEVKNKENAGNISVPGGGAGEDVPGHREQIYLDVMKGNRKQITQHTREAVEKGTAPDFILNEMLLPAINEVGELFDQGKYFLPQLIASAEAMKLSIEYLEPLLAVGKGRKEMPVVVIATVAGDIHDIGKNLVAMMFKNYGFQVIDLGKDVPREVIVHTAQEHHAAIVALSALMTTTMQEMKRVVDYAREQKLTAKIMIGGAVITEEYAAEIGADAYSRDAAEAVRVAKKLLNIKE